MPKKGLGRGLQALIPEEINDQSGIKEIALSEIEVNPDQPRKEFKPEALAELAESLRLHGLLQPILVRPTGGKYRIIAGERRFRAAEIAGFTKISCIVQDCSVQEMTERALVENIQRANLSPVEEGLAYRRLMDEYGLTQEQVAQRVGKGRPTIANLLRIIQLPEPVLNWLREDKISLGHAKLLVGLGDSSLQVLAAEKAAKEQLSVRETEELVRRLIGQKENKRRAKAPEASLMRGMEDKLQSVFQTKVKLRGDQNRGKIEIEYFSQEELNRLLDLWKVEID